MTIGLDSMFKAIQLPTGVTDLATSLADMDRDTLTHDEVLNFVITGTTRTTR